MFYYYGAKNRLARYYPAPQGDVIIEPFAGSAAYAQFWRRTAEHVVLFDTDERVVALWHQLQSMTAPQILALPTPEAGTYAADPLVDMLVKMAAASNGVSVMTGPLLCPSRVPKVWSGMIRRMADRVDDARAWTVKHGDYTDSLPFVLRQFPDSTYTWFIDPPYQSRTTTTNRQTSAPHGQGYRGGAGLDFDLLAQWIDALPGQVIVCEQAGARWRDDFQPLRMHQDSNGRMSQEVVALRGHDAMGGRHAHQLELLLGRTAGSAGGRQ